MNDPEVARLRRLRDAALRSRAIARALLRTRWAARNALLERTACACWRIARAVSGRLTAHPYPKYQRGPRVRSMLLHALRGRFLALSRRSRLRALSAAHHELQALERVVADVRAVTLAPDLGDTLGRSQWEIDTLLSLLECETRSGAPEVRVAPRTASESTAPPLAAPLGTDWPYLAL